jgi:hypothetical protein
LTDEHAGALLEGVARAAFANAGDAGVSLDSDEHVALVEVRVGVLGTVDADAGDFHGWFLPGLIVARKSKLIGAQHFTVESSACADVQ